jgi:CheY-like chemotaxis protein
VLSVKDTGTGIDPRDLEKVFDPFYTTKEIDHGTGLGLASVLGIVQSYEGFIQVESELGRGSEFKVWLREYRGHTTEESDALRVGSAPSGRGELVLVVDDEPAVRSVLGASIERFGYRVLLASDASSALRLFDEQPADIAAVVADIAMPRLDGFALASEIRRRRNDLPIVVMTAALNEEKRASFASLGVVEFLIKPFRTDALLRALDRVLTTKTTIVEPK